ncbi:hypothetical protein GM921_13020 [Pedobacter sp. LMG 31464]|uniref:Lipocalin-like domain-containing protein n=1 Tax=Pedobacter planticolens TaxID=2679964 RepID=A0A923IVU8_9SPHI|nr:hypothetical protein [Pedobacter planticolens]MBB2146416.1 hypothetical protein [Pedobacter planticolens]
MKTKLLLLLLLPLLMGASCKKDKDNGLTKPTQIGANTFSCKINGQIFTPKQDLFGPTPLYSQVDIYNGNNTLNISASNPNTYITNMHFNINSFKGVGEYSIDIINGVYVDCYLNIPSPNLEKSQSGTIRITKYQGEIVSGTFEFNLKHGTENIAVTSGRFDLTLR